MERNADARLSRRNVLAGAAAGLLALEEMTRPANAYERCMPTPMGPACEVGIAINRLPTVYAIQRMSQWCWAASLEMIFAYYGYRVSQEQIVFATFGRLENLPAFTGAVISRNLNRVWDDANGRRCRSEIRGLYDFNAGVAALSNQDIISALGQERPLLLGNTSHAVVLTAVAYQPTGFGPRVFNIGVLDPLPGQGLRGAQSPAELVPMHQGGGLRYLALPVVRRA